MSINRGFDDSREVAKVIINALNTDRQIPVQIESALKEYEDISRAHYTGGFTKINEVRGAYRRIEKQFPFHAEQLIAAFLNAQVRQSLLRQ